MQSNYVFQLNYNRQSLDMIHSARARQLQKQGKAATIRRYPYALVRTNLILSPTTQEYILKIDPGSVWTGFAIQRGQDIVWRMELKHRGLQIKLDLQKRTGFRKRRRSCNLWYRKAKFNRHKPEGWLAPSLLHRLLTVETWIKRLIRLCPIKSIEIEQVRFDTQKLQSPEISGLEYQQGTLFGYECRQYLLEKWGRQCTYCGTKDVPLQIEHIQSKAKGGSNRISNLCLACDSCNKDKGTRHIRDFLSDKPDLLNCIQDQAKKPLAHAAAVNSTRYAIVKMAKNLCSNVKCWTGGRTKFNRTQQGLEKSHSIDAACVGESGALIKLLSNRPLIVECRGHGNRQARRVNALGFPAVKNPKEKFGHIKTGDIVKIIIPKDRKRVLCGTYVTRVKTPTKKGCEVLINNCRVGFSSMLNISFVCKSDGYNYII